jgi:ribonuclease R
VTSERKAKRRERHGPKPETARRPKREAPARGRKGGRAPREEIIGLLRLGRGRAAAARVTPFRDEHHRQFSIARGAMRGARDGEWVRIEPTGTRGRAKEARVAEVLGPPGAAEADFRVVVARHRLEVAFPPEVLAQVEAFGRSAARDRGAQREDLRGLPFLTIDPVTARDHDDAVCVEDLPRGGARLWVAIADVAAFVPEGSALDREALRRGNSVYFPDRAIPMLPHELSGDLCSLRADVDRGVLVVALEISASGAVGRRRFARGLIRSRAKLSYDAAARVMDPSAEVLAGAEPPTDAVVVEQLQRLARVARTLQERRFEGGSIDFDLPTAEIVLGDDGHPVDVVEASRTLAHRAIEEAMLAANRAVAEELLAARIPLLHRVHEAPPPEDLAALEDLLRAFGLLERDRSALLDARQIARAVARAVGRPEERLVNLVTLRSMQQARYSEADRGHFALAFSHYTHFTSPIRRYSDLVVHRALLDHLAGSEESRARALARGEGLARVAARLSARERAAVEAERDMVTLKKCVFLLKHVGAEYDGVIGSVAPHGLYVTLTPFFVEGLVHVARLPSGATYDERGHAFVLRRGRGRWGLGDPVRIRVEAVDPARGWISFSLVGVERSRPALRGRRRGYAGA